jgi:hypothetical protein
VLVQDGKLAHTSFLPWCNDVPEMPMHVQEKNLTRWNDVVRDEPVLVKEKKLACVSFATWWNDVIRYEFLFVQEGKIACTSFPP